MKDIINVEYESPYTSFGPQTPVLSITYDYSTGEFSYSFGDRTLPDEQIQAIIAFLKNKAKIAQFLRMNLNEGFHSNQEFITISYDGHTNKISQSILSRRYEHPFHCTSYRFSL